MHYFDSKNEYAHTTKPVVIQPYRYLSNWGLGTAVCFVLSSVFFVFFWQEGMAIGALSLFSIRPKCLVKAQSVTFSYPMLLQSRRSYQGETQVTKSHCKIHITVRSTSQDEWENEVEWNGKLDLRNAEFLAAEEACVSICWPTLGLEALES